MTQTALTTGAMPGATAVWCRAPESLRLDERPVDLESLDPAARQRLFALSDRNEPCEVSADP